MIKMLFYNSILLMQTLHGPFEFLKCAAFVYNHFEDTIPLLFYFDISIHCMYVSFVILHYHIQVNHGGQYITVPHIPEAIQVNIGGVMQRWTGDQYIAPVSGGSHSLHTSTD